MQKLNFRIHWGRGADRAIPFNIHTPPVDEFSQNLPPKKEKIKVLTQHSLQKLTDFSFPPQKKTNFSSNPSEKAAKIKGNGPINPSETTFIAPSENLVNRGGVYIKWNGPQGGLNFPLPVPCTPSSRPLP